MKVGISGLGRIGRLVLRSIFGEEQPKVNVAAINCSHPASTIAHLLKYDSVHGIWNADISYTEDEIAINGHPVKIVRERKPEELPWDELGVGFVIDATGKFNNREGAVRHLAAGARKVLITAPGKQMDATIVMGVNENSYCSENHHLLSAASCTTNCVAPVLKIMDDAFAVKSGWITTVHAFTNDQNHLDNPHKDLRRARGCTQSVIPTTTGVGKALLEILPHLAPHVHGISLRVPTPDVSLADLTLELEREVTVEEVRDVLKGAAQGSYAAIFGYTEEPLVSSDFIGNDKSAVVDGLSLMATGRQLKVLAWYDNEWAYACRVVDLCHYIVQQGQLALHMKRTELMVPQVASGI
ncbi:type I glyceraldehyde-3-phosphate dehydrogenase [Paenibacillus larvae]|uniref:Glyceraldehyde-3-phosphate dehydrogenase 2 n=4 Tax=Paenibacillus larvae TaxID=1464 RepID=V9W497_9BACL|nr:type I glyceraldehyde-3-phosphate dehydrogenase [Paenibacillus larvae]AHD04455.1 glyceraldehyde-3-phosphate dehydrogenase 2 [Paenibacillus larvae subsp. larvae DSM 25430]AQR78326.1 type I glyceraldehyde-3-phosphate dehydrogenase [Paenibacillus larvae subsp. larvae]AVF20456.1 glyceraldehyde-3-phosphate dehydrogenase 2 [Paenibacillus larvae subsp. larvae]AVG11058.1 glyceraldehyde-3-phosphate dehydrogenase 2 [Paenibacillus larvae subsp. larvae DSM 25430]ETK28590.1 glyceraldehyde-3-phosphate de